MSNLKESWSSMEIAKKWRIWTAVSLGLVLVAALIVGIFGFNLGQDFTDGGIVDVEIGYYLSANEDKYEEFEAIVFEVLDEFNLEYSGSQKYYYNEYLYGVSVRFTTTVNGKTATAEELNIIGKLLNGAQDEEYSEGAVIKQNRATVEETKKLKALLQGSAAYTELDANGDFDGTDTDPVVYKGIYDRIIDEEFPVLNVDGSPLLTDPNDPDSDPIYYGDPNYSIMSPLKIKAGATTAGFDFSLFWNLLLAVGVALVAVFLYVFWRFGLRNAIVAASVSVHNIFVVTALAAICRFVLNASFTAVLALSVVYTLYDIALLFARIKENKAKPALSEFTAEQYADTSVKENFRNSGKILTAVTVIFILIAVVGLIVGTSAVTQVVLPIAAGFIAVTYSSVFITPSIWALVENRFTSKK